LHRRKKSIYQKGGKRFNSGPRRKGRELHSSPGKKGRASRLTVYDYYDLTGDTGKGTVSWTPGGGKKTDRKETTNITG